MRTVVIGASSGLGRCIGVALGERGDTVALLARRQERLDSAVASIVGAGGSAHAIACDVTEEKACVEAVERAAEALGGIDAVIYTPGIGPLRPVAELDQDTWRRVFDTNVIGASIVTAAALPHLAESQGVAVYLTSKNGALTDPWAGLSAYAVSKAALEKLIDAWRVEHPSVGFTKVVVGECMGGEGDAMSEFAGGWDPDLIGTYIPDWMARGHMSGGLMDGSAVVDAVTAVLTVGASARIPSIVVVPRPPVAA